jgi:hypothetical protein
MVKYYLYIFNINKKTLKQLYKQLNIFDNKNNIYSDFQWELIENTCIFKFDHIYNEYDGNSDNIISNHVYKILQELNCNEYILSKSLSKSKTNDFKFLGKMY